MKQLSMKETFCEIYQNRKWYRGSGSGSLVENTVEYRKFLQDFINRQDIKTVIDLGCGDWQFSKLIDWDSVSYTGIDVVPSVIKDNKVAYGTRPNINFICADVLSYEPQADLIIMKDVLQHWPNEDIQHFFAHSARAKYILITNSIQTIDITDPNKEVPFNQPLNHDIARGGLHSIDLSKSPFNLPVKEVLRYQSIKRHAPFKDIKSVVLLEN